MSTAIATLNDKRRFLRHPISVPIQVQMTNEKIFNGSESIDLSQGGLCFLWTRKLSKGMPIFITIPVKEKNFKIKAQITYCQRQKNTAFFRTGAAFVDYASAFQAKLA